MRAIRLMVLCLLACGLANRALEAQSGVVKRNVNLRVGPGISFDFIRLLLPGDEFTLLEPIATGGYYHVTTAAQQEGWVWRNNVRVLTADSPIAAPTGPPEVFRGCPLEGNAQTEARRRRNRDKNRVNAPGASELDPAVALAALLVPGDDRARWQPDRGASIVGLVVEVKAGSSETVNCGASGIANTDAHIEVALDQQSIGKTERIIVEVTPRWRDFMASRGEDWSTARLRTLLEGRCARFTGWLFFDDEHDDEAENTTPGGGNNWRATAWEIHPVTTIEQVPCPN